MVDSILSKPVIIVTGYMKVRLFVEILIDVEKDNSETVLSGMKGWVDETELQLESDFGARRDGICVYRMVFLPQ
jgi:hypothetical protein